MEEPMETRNSNNWKINIKQLIDQDDDNMKESVYCGPEIRRNDHIKLEMLQNFGREIQ
jgi:hypothetical protein